MSNQVHVIDVINSRSGNSNNTITSGTKSWHTVVSTQSLSYFRTQIYQGWGQKAEVIEGLINWGLVFITPAWGKNYWFSCNINIYQEIVRFSRNLLLILVLE